VSEVSVAAAVSLHDQTAEWRLRGAKVPAFEVQQQSFDVVLNARGNEVGGFDSHWR